MLKEKHKNRMEVATKHQSAILKGVFSSLVLLLFYFSIATLVSGWSYAKVQFSNYWYYIVTLAFGFGIQVGLYSYLKVSLKHRASARVIATTGTTSGAAMISCCTHYLANLLPILGAVGVISVITQYQIELFWVGIVFNLAGLTYMIYQIRKHLKMV